MACAVAATVHCPYWAEWPAARSVRWPIWSLAWSTTVATAWVGITRLCCTAWVTALVGLPCQDGGQCRVEGWLVGTRVVTGSTSCEGGVTGPGQVPGALSWGPEGLVAGGSPPVVAG